VIKSSVGERLDRWIHRLFPFLFLRRIDPDLLTVTGALVSALAAAAFVGGELRWAGVLILAGGFFDLVDGVVARHHGISTRFGAFLDSTLDRFVDMALFVGIAVHYARQGEPASVLLTGVALTATALVSYSKARAELHVKRFDVGLLERGERIGLLAAGAILGLMIPALWVIAIGSTITVGQRFALAKRELDRLDAQERSEPQDPPQQGLPAVETSPAAEPRPDLQEPTA
jgi:CDP-diacylglycerol--glycerol-3-phosphate 3-phosphatidyltransferase